MCSQWAFVSVPSQPHSQSGPTIIIKGFVGHLHATYCCRLHKPSQIQASVFAMLWRWWPSLRLGGFGSSALEEAHAWATLQDAKAKPQKHACTHSAMCSEDAAFLEEYTLVLLYIHAKLSTGLLPSMRLSCLCRQWQPEQKSCVFVGTLGTRVGTV